jgi:hypothetical protein
MEVGIINELASKIEERFKITVPRNGNCFSVKINGNSTIIITSSEVSGSLFFCAQIGSILKNQGADSLRQLLNANLFGKDTGKSIISVHEATQNIVLFREITTENVDFSRIMKTLGQFAKQAAVWETHIQRDPNEEEPPENRSAQSDFDLFSQNTIRI